MTTTSVSSSTPTAEPRLNPWPGLIATGLALVATGAVSAWAWYRLPDDARVPVHWNLAGEIDRYAGKFQGLAMIPAIMLVTSVLMAVLPLVLPRRQHLASSARGYTATWVGALVLLVAVHMAIVITAVNPTANGSGGTLVVRVVVVGIGLLYAVIGNYLPKTRSNWIFGIRTPWTLDSERSWTRTHRLGGMLFFWYGLTLAITAFLLPPVPLLALTVGGAVAIAATATGYAWWTWRTEHQRS
jgi:uncharacterized membrane protein